MRTERGFTYFELLATVIILMILASAILPTAKVLRKRQKEIELRRSLRIVRTALDGYHDAVRQGRIGGTDVKVGSEGYPPDLDVLVKGVSQVGKIDVKLKFLRRVPVDPMTGTKDWRLRSMQDEPDSASWGGQNVFDVFTRSAGKALDGTNYADW